MKTRVGDPEKLRGIEIAVLEVSLPIYQRMTIRNWNTTTTLLRLMHDSAE